MKKKKTLTFFHFSEFANIPLDNLPPTTGKLEKCPKCGSTLFDTFSVHGEPDTDCHCRKCRHNWTERLG